MKRLFSTILALLICLGLTACNQSGGPAPSGPTQAPTTQGGENTYVYEFDGMMGKETAQFELNDDGTCRFSLPGNPVLSDVYAGTYLREGDLVTVTGLSNEDITTDATIMGGYTMTRERRRAIPASIMAGCDMLVFSTDVEEDLSYLLQGLEDGLLTMERLDEAVIRVLALKAKVCFQQSEICPVPAVRWHRMCADKAITLVKNLQTGALPMIPERYSKIRLITLGKDEIPDGSVRMLAKEYLESQGFQVELYDPFSDELHGTSKLTKERLTLYFANYEQASNQTVVRIGWCPKHALDIPRFVEEEPCVFVSLANPYHLQDVPRIKTYINAYTATRDTIELTIDKLMGRSEFRGVSPVDPFCGLPDARL